MILISFARYTRNANHVDYNYRHKLLPFLLSELRSSSTSRRRPIRVSITLALSGFWPSSEVWHIPSIFGRLYPLAPKQSIKDWKYWKLACHGLPPLFVAFPMLLTFLLCQIWPFRRDNWISWVQEPISAGIDRALCMTNEKSGSKWRDDEYLWCLPIYRELERIETRHGRR